MRIISGEESARASVFVQYIFKNDVAAIFFGDVASR